MAAIVKPKVVVTIREKVLLNDQCKNLDGLAYYNFLKASKIPFKVCKNLPMDVRVGSKYWTFNEALHIELEQAESNHPLANGRKISKIIARLDSIYLSIMANFAGRQSQNLVSDAHQVFEELQTVLDENLPARENLFVVQIYNAVVAKKIRETRYCYHGRVSQLLRSNDAHTNLMNFMVQFEDVVKDDPNMEQVSDSSGDE